MSNRDTEMSNLNVKNMLYIIVFRNNGDYFIECCHDGSIKVSKFPYNKSSFYSISTCLHITLLEKRGVLTTEKELRDIIQLPFNLSVLQMDLFPHYGVKIDKKIGKEIYDRGYNLS